MASLGRALQACSSGENHATEVCNETLTKRLQRHREELATRVKEIDEVLRLLADHPETQPIIDALTKLGV